MITITRGRLAASALAVMLCGTQLNPATASAEPETPQQPETAAQPTEVLHNVVYRARVDGVARGARISYAAQDDQTQIANPTMVPGRTFEANTVLPASQAASMRVSVEWPYSANLHCEILVDDQLVAQADDFIAPRLTPNREDPNYGALRCEAPVSRDAIPAVPAAPADAPADPGSNSAPPPTV